MRRPHVLPTRALASHAPHAPNFPFAATATIPASRSSRLLRHFLQAFAS